MYGLRILGNLNTESIYVKVLEEAHRQPYWLVSQMLMKDLACDRSYIDVTAD